MAVGSVIIFSGNSIPEHYLVCDGSAISRADYSDLFDVIGTTYGSGDGVSTFNLPDMTGKVSLGESNYYTQGSFGGESEVTLIEDNLPSHLHAIPAHGHSNNIVMKTPSLAHSITTQPAFNYVRVNTASKIYYGKGVSVKTGRGGATNMSRATNVAITAHAATACTMSGGITDCPAMTSGDAGDGNAHNNMMPYIALVYLIQAEPDVPPGPVIPSMVLFNGALPVAPSGAYIAGRK